MLNNAYREHRAFEQLKVYAEFYDCLSTSAINHTPEGLRGFNPDTHAFLSMQGTIESIYYLLEMGRIGDAFALVRKYYDAVVVNSYANLLLRDNFDVDTWTSEEVRRWLTGEAKMPKGNVIEYIDRADQLSGVNKLYKGDARPREIRNRCNDFVHYNYYDNFVLNASELYLDEERLRELEYISSDMEYIFIRHLAYVFTINEEYMTSRDYLDMLDAGQTPEEGSQYWAAPYIEDVFKHVLEPKRPDIATEIKTKSVVNFGFPRR